jgi:hypothetical protein
MDFFIKNLTKKYKCQASVIQMVLVNIHNSTPSPL